MKNLTLAVDEDVLARYRVLAAEQRTTVNALIREHMADAIGAGDRRKTAVARLVELSRRSEAFDAAHAVADAEGARFDRDETYSGRRFEWPRNV